MQNLTQSLANEADLMSAFVDLLKQEQTDLSQGKTEHLATLAEQKSQIAAKLELFGTQRNAALNAGGLASGLHGMAAWFKAQAPQANASHGQAEQYWNKLISLAAEAKELNRVNGDLIRLHMQHNAQALEALRVGGNSLDLYGPDGQSKAFGQKRINDAV